MFACRQAFRLGTRLVLTRESVDLRQIPLIFKEKLDANFYGGTFVHTKANLREAIKENEEANNRKPLGKLQGKLKLMFTCKKCNYRNSKIISKVAYEKGLVIVRCEGCKNNHLIADNLGWFSEMKNTKNIERFLASKGETVRKVHNYDDGYIEVVTQAELDLIQHNKDMGHSIEGEENESCIEEKKVGTSEKT
ncbi:uncharacterized protein LOC143374181 [Andrena cerasifolii]|uniref:uncharacterized protein LOC143374181 n=1 Tax=Andrena cerasifolii TaxID=2819439 RepID=UPI0040377783